MNFIRQLKWKRPYQNILKVIISAGVKSDDLL